MNRTSWMRCTVVLGMLLCFANYSNQAEAGKKYYYAPPSYYVAIPGYHAPPLSMYPSPIVMYEQPVVYEPQVVYPPPAVYSSPAPTYNYGFYAPAPSMYLHTQEIKDRPWNNEYRYKYKVYRPSWFFGRKKVYEYEYKVKDGRVRIDEDFDD